CDHRGTPGEERRFTGIAAAAMHHEHGLVAEGIATHDLEFSFEHDIKARIAIAYVPEYFSLRECFFAAVRRQFIDLRIRKDRVHLRAPVVRRAGRRLGILYCGCGGGHGGSVLQYERSVTAGRFMLPAAMDG